MSSRRELLELHGRMYGELQLALAFTRTNNPAKGDPKAVLGSWDKTKPLLSAAQGEGRMAAAMTGNPVVVLRPSNLIGIENDTPDGLERIAALALPETVTVRSSEPWKRHYWFRPWSETVPKFAAFRFEQGGVSADTGRYFLCPPAIHPSGAVYEFINSPADHEIAVISEDHYRQLVRLWKQTEHEERERLQIDPDAKVTPGRRRQAIFRYACQQRRWTSADEEIVQLALIWNTNHCDPPLSEEQVRYQVKGAMKKKGGQEVARDREVAEDEQHYCRGDHCDGDARDPESYPTAVVRRDCVDGERQGRAARLAAGHGHPPHERCGDDDHENRHRMGPPPPQSTGLYDDERQDDRDQRPPKRASEHRQTAGDEVENNDRCVGKARPACDP